MPRKYDQEFKDDAVAYYYSSGKSQVQAALDLGVPEQTFNRWVREAKGTKRVTKAQETEHQEVLELRKKNAKLEMENEILKKAMAVFAKEK